VTGGGNSHPWHAPPPRGEPVFRPSLPTQRVLHLVSRFDREQQYFLYLPGSGANHAPVLVTVHGLSRNAEEHANLFASRCEQLGVVLIAPLFPEDRARDYQRLGRWGRGTRADVALESILEEVALMTGAATAPTHLFGFSGGAQFAHRYAMAHPRRVARVVAASAGWYTFPDGRKRYPYGIRASRDLPDVRFDPEEFLQVPITVIVGERDTTNVDMRSTKRVNRQQGPHRLERARKWVDAMHDAARAHHLDPLVTFESIPGGDHSFANLMLTGGLGDRVFAALFGDAVARAPENDRG
jgi:pimeloyl-ACP methyl ester carboxylesterase